MDIAELIEQLYKDGDPRSALWKASTTSRCVVSHSDGAFLIFLGHVHVLLSLAVSYSSYVFFMSAMQFRWLLLLIVSKRLKSCESLHGPL